jgi:hypothetical protein
VLHILSCRGYFGPGLAPQWMLAFASMTAMAQKCPDIAARAFCCR